MIGYSLTMIWNDRLRFLPAVLAVAFSALLVALQFGLLIGTLSFISTPIDSSGADIWVASRSVPSIDLGIPIPVSWLSRLDIQPEAVRTEYLMYGFGSWLKPEGGSLVCCILGSRLEDDALGAVRGLTPELRALLTEPGSIVVDESELNRLGLAPGGSRVAEISDRRVRVVGTVRGYKSIGGPYIFCSRRTARLLLRLFQNRPNWTMYLLMRCRKAEDVGRVVGRLRAEYPLMSSYASRDFSIRTRMHWLTQSKAGIALAFTAVLALLVGLVVTSQTLYAATLASMREYAVLRALGIPRWRVAAMVMLQSAWIGVAGVIVSVPATVALARGADAVGAKVTLPPWLLAAVVALTMALSLVSGLGALRSLRQVEPIALLR